MVEISVESLLIFGLQFLEDAQYHSSSLTNQSIASSRASNLRNSRREKVVNAS
jgi:hypothetical protein